jgi:DNA-binding NtrC family response regulator
MSRMAAARVLLVSREPSAIEAVGTICDLTSALRLEVSGDVQTACRRLTETDVRLVLAHLPPGEDAAGLGQVLRAAAARPCPALVLADRCREDQAQLLLRSGAAGYLALAEGPAALARLADIFVGHSPPTPAGRGEAADPADPDGLLAQLRRVAPQDTTLLLTGETGTGKARLARLAHELSGRREQPFLVVDCGALSASLVESELFGHAKGAFTGAGRGTVLLDEVGALPLPLQPKLLRAVDERVFEPLGGDQPQPLQARLIAASSAPLERAVAEGRFHRDLYRHLNLVSFELPPLRERRGRIAALAGQFLGECAARNRPEVKTLSGEALRALEGYDWPGNIRELRNVIERAVALCPGSVVGLEDLPAAIRYPRHRLASGQRAQRS